MIDYVSYSPAFCSPGSGCSAVRASGFGYLFGGRVPVPAIGIAGFALLFMVSLRPLLRPILHPIAWAGGAIALVFIGLQAFWIKEYCKLCMVVDGAAVLAAGAAFVHKRLAGDKPDEEIIAPWAWLVIGGIAVGTPLIWPSFKPQAPVPPGIAQYYQAGKINVVEFADFECPFCRKLHPLLKKLIDERGDRVTFTRLNMPLTQHEHAMDAAKGAVCAEKLGKKDEMADQLFETEDLSPAGVRRVAVGLGIDAAAFDACIADPGTQARIQKESKILRDAGFQGLPTTYIGARQIVGAQSEDAFREAFEQAARGEGTTGIPMWLLLAVAGLACVAVGYFGRVPALTEAPKRTRRDSAGSKT